MSAILIAYDARTADGLSDDEANSVRGAIRECITKNGISYREIGYSVYVIKTAELVDAVHNRLLDAVRFVLKREPSKHVRLLVADLLGPRVLTEALVETSQWIAAEENRSAEPLGEPL